MVAIQYIGLNDLDSFEQSKLKFIVEKHLPKLERDVQNAATVVIHVKIHKHISPTKKAKDTDNKSYNTKATQRKKYTVHARFLHPAKPFEAEGVDWDLA